jgi:hypothetical protein
VEGQMVNVPQEESFLASKAREKAESFLTDSKEFL